MREPPALFVSAVLRSVHYVPASPRPQIFAILCKFARKINLALSWPGTSRDFLGFAPGQFTLSPNTSPEQFPVASELALELRGQAGVKPRSKLLGSRCVPEMWQSSAMAKQGTTACHPWPTSGISRTSLTPKCPACHYPQWCACQHLRQCIAGTASLLKKKK